MKKLFHILTSFAFLFLIFSQGIAQTHNKINTGLYPLYPQNHSKYVSRQTDIIFKSKKKISEKYLSGLSFMLKGSKSGIIKGKTYLKSDKKTILFKPNNKLLPNEIVNVLVYKLGKNTSKPLVQYLFTVSPLDYPIKLPNSFSQKDNIYGSKNYIHPKNSLSQNGLPSDFPYFKIIVKNNPGVGNYFVNASRRDTTLSCYNLIIDTTGFPLYFQKFPPNHRENFFTYHPQVATITYFDNTISKFIAFNNSFQLIGYYQAENGYSTDIHELIIQENGSYWVLAYDPEPVDMSQIYPGGCSSAIVIGTIIQQIDNNHDVIFQWSSWDHFSILDADTNIVDLTSCVIDYAHGNALTFDSIGNIVLSSRNMSEITKIDRLNGNIIWRWGGKHNQFTFTNDTIPFRAQHHIRYHGNHTYSMFDNGNGRVPPYSRALTYTLNETDYTASLKNDLQKTNPPDFTPFMGSNQLLENGSLLIGWAANYETYVLTQYSQEDEIQFDIQSVDTFGLVSYRAMKTTWETALFYFEKDTLNFGDNILIGDSAFASVCLTNNSDDPLTINGYYSTDSVVSLKTKLPITIPANNCDSLTLRFEPKNEIPISAVFSVYYQTDTSRISNQIRVLGGGILDKINTKNINRETALVLPNPAHNYCYVKFSNNLPIQQITLYKINGQIIFNKIYNGLDKIKLNNIKRGIYFLKIYSKEKNSIVKLIMQ